MMLCLHWLLVHISLPLHTDFLFYLYILNFYRYDIVNCNLKDKPEWLLAKNPEGKVPTIETLDGKILFESLIVADYLDEAFPSQRPLHPTDPYKKALDKIFLEKFGTVCENICIYILY